MEQRNRYRLPGLHSGGGVLWGAALACLIHGQAISQESSTTVPPTGDAIPSATLLADRYHASPEELTRWIEELASPVFRVREKAAHNLSQCDASALGVLSETAKTTADPEVRSRCVAIAEAIYEEDIGARIKAFLSDADVSRSHGFEGWLPFAEIVGQGRLAKRLFLELFETQRILTESAYPDPAPLRDLSLRVAENAYRKFRSASPNELGEVVALLYCSVRLKGEVPAEVQGMLVRLLRTAPYTLHVSRPPHRNTLRKLVGAWMDTAEFDRPAMMQIAVEQDIPEGKRVARKVLAQPTCDPIEFELAIASLFRFGTADDLDVLKRWTADEQPLQHFTVNELPLMEIPGQGDNAKSPPPIEPQFDLPESPFKQPSFGPSVLGERRVYELRYQDLAIATSMKLIESPEFEKVFPRATPHFLRGYVIQSLAFPLDAAEKRQVAIDTWKRIEAQTVR